MTPDRPELLYLHDPLCGWCYGMSPVIQQVQTAFAGRVDVSVLCGGMNVGEHAGPIAADWEFIQATMPTVEQVAGVRFGEAFRQLGETGTYFYDSEPPSRAIAVFRQLSTDEPGLAVQFAHDVQLALFRDGRNLNNPSTYDALVEPFGLDVAEFRRRLSSPDAAQATRLEFAAVGKLGVQGFPTTVLRIGQQGYVLARGYQAFDALAAGIEKLLS